MAAKVDQFFAATDTCDAEVQDRCFFDGQYNGSAASHMRPRYRNLMICEAIHYAPH